MAEPNAKRFRSEVKNCDDPDGPLIVRIELDMRKYGKWVRDLSPKELISIFEIALNVKESTMLTVDVSQDLLEKALTSQTEPVRKNMGNIEAEVKQQLEKVEVSVTQHIRQQVNEMSTEVQKFKNDLKTEIRVSRTRW